MQAAGIGPPVLNLKSLAPGRAQGYPDQDLFNSLLQQRISSQGRSASNSSTRGLDQALLRAQLRKARPAASNSPLATNRSPLSVRFPASKLRETQSPKPWKMGISRKLIERLDNAQKQEQTSTPAKPADASSENQSWKAHLRSRALRLAQENPQAAPAAVSPAQVEMPPVLKALIEFLNQQPGQALKVPPDRLPEVKAFLLRAGLPPEQVENLLTSPRFQEQGLSAAAVQSAWQKAVQDTLQQTLAASELQMPVSNNPAGNNTISNNLANPGQGPGPLNPLLNIINQPDYQEMWQKLTLPPQSLADLRLELQQLGVPPEALIKLNEQNFPQGITLSQVWKLIQQVPKPATAAPANPDSTRANMPPESPALLNGTADMEKWRQLLLQAGMDPELAQVLVSGSSPTNREELRTSLLRIAPPPDPPSEIEVPKPLYLPPNVRIRPLPVLQQQPDTGQTGSDGSGNWPQNFAFSPQTQEVNLSGIQNLNHFLAFLNGNAPFKAEHLGSPEVAGGPASTVHAFLTPEARETLWAQVQTGILGNLRPGENQVTLTLNPPEMGKLHLTLNVKGEMVEVTAVATHEAVAEAGAAGVQHLAQALNQQGLILTNFQFHHQDEAPGESHLAFFQNAGDQRQAGRKEEDNRWEHPPQPQRRRGAGGIDCFA